MAKKYYAGKKQSNGEYVFVSEIRQSAIQATNIIENALGFATKDYATDIAEIANLIDADEYSVIEIETTIKEI